MEIPRRRFLHLAGAAVAGPALLPDRGRAATHGRQDSDARRQRREAAYEVRASAAKAEREKPVAVQQTNGDEQRYPKYIASYSKALPHNDLGEVDPAVYARLLGMLEKGTLADFETLRSDSRLKLATPIAGREFYLSGPDAQAITIPPPPSFGSAEAAIEMVELYWMVLLRDVPFARYRDDPLVAAAVDELSRLCRTTHCLGSAGRPITPDSLFRPNYPGVNGGPRISQFLLWSYEFDGNPVEQRKNTLLPVAGAEGIEFLTGYDEWLWAQRGFPGTAPIARARMDPQPRYIRSGRDLGWYANTTGLNLTYLNTAGLLSQFGRVAFNDANPYKHTRLLVNGGVVHLSLLDGLIANSYHFMYQKWVHRTIRPEVFSGRLHNQLSGKASYPIDSALLNSGALPKIYDSMASMNRRRGIADGKGTYLLPCVWAVGSPTFPSYPQGHGTATGIGTTLAKAWFDENFVIPESLAVSPNADGTSLEPYRYGKDGPPLTIGGELNKLAYNITWGRNFAGVHTYSDAFAANAMGEEIAMRALAEDRTTSVERFGGFSFTKFDGTKVTV